MLVTQTEFLRWWKMCYHPPTCFETIPFYNLFPSCCETIRWCVTWTGQYRFPIKVSFCRNRSVIAPFADQKYFGTIRDVEILIFPNNLDFSSKCVFAQAKKPNSLAFVFVSSVRSSNSHPDLLLIHQHPLFQITPVLNTGLSLSEPLQLYKGYNAI